MWSRLKKTRPCLRLGCLRLGLVRPSAADWGDRLRRYAVLKDLKFTTSRSFTMAKFVYLLDSEERFTTLTLPMLRLLLFKAQGCKDLWKQSKPCHGGIHWKALVECSQMSTDLWGFQSPVAYGFTDYTYYHNKTGPRPVSQKLDNLLFIWINLWSLLPFEWGLKRKIMLDQRSQQKAIYALAKQMICCVCYDLNILFSLDTGAHLIN